MTSAFAIFYVGSVSLPMFVAETNYMRQMHLSQRALSVTNPDMRFVVMTDEATAPLLERDYDIRVVAKSDLPYAMTYTMAQAEFIKSKEFDYIVLAEADCLANRDLTDAMRPGDGLGLTYVPKRAYRHTLGTIDPFLLSPVYNQAYVKDHDLAEWFLRRAARRVAEYQDQSWYADQAAWNLAIQPFPVDTPQEIIRDHEVDGRRIAMYPCSTHNHFIRDSGWPKKGTEAAFMVHFKGLRKQHMRRYLENFLLPWHRERIKDLSP